MDGRSGGSSRRMGSGGRSGGGGGGGRFQARDFRTQSSGNRPGGRGPPGSGGSLGGYILSMIFVHKSKIVMDAQKGILIEMR